MAKVIIASDIHGRKSRAEALALIFQREKPDKIILLGDFLYNGPRNGVPEDYDPMAVINALSPYKDIIVAVRGNCDARIDLDLLPFAMPDFQEIAINGTLCHLTHGHLLDELKGVKKGEAILYGHTHKLKMECQSGVLLLNPGSISFPKGENPPTYLLWEGDKLEFRDILSDRPVKVGYWKKR